jgi:hypothetical protein
VQVVGRGRQRVRVGDREPYRAAPCPGHVHARGHDPLLPPTVEPDWSPELMPVPLLVVVPLSELSPWDVPDVDVPLFELFPVVAAAEWPTAETRVTVRAMPAAPTPPAASAERRSSRRVRGFVVMPTTVPGRGSGQSHRCVKVLLSAAGRRPWCSELQCGAGAVGESWPRVGHDERRAAVRAGRPSFTLRGGGVSGR